jgi:pimeloyl-ACP methyl ester carboxylesterase
MTKCPWWLSGLLPFEHASIPADRSDVESLRGFVGPVGARTSYLRCRNPKRRDDTILLIHGAGMNARTWSSQLRGLSQEHDVIAVDLPGHGASPLPDEAGLAEYVDAANAVLKDRGGPVMIAGHSLGGAVALALAAHKPDRVKGLMLISTCMKLSHANRRVDELLHALPMPLRKVLLDASMHAMFGPGASGQAVQHGLQDLLACSPAAVDRDIEIARSMDLEDAARSLRIPVRLLCGSADSVTPVSASQHLVDVIPGAKLEVVHAAGHMLPLERPDTVGERILQFANSLR